MILETIIYAKYLMIAAAGIGVFVAAPTVMQRLRGARFILIFGMIVGAWHLNEHLHLWI